MGRTAGSDTYRVELACGHTFRRQIRGGIVEPSYRCPQHGTDEVTVRYMRLEET
jgi:hypothetical protein